MSKDTYWDNLKTLNCPKCYGDLERDGRLFKCGECDFVISEIRLREIVEPMFDEAGDRSGRANFEDLMDTFEI